MGASFRNIGEIAALAGCDRLTISPQLLGELAKDEGPLPRRLDPKSPGEGAGQRSTSTRRRFRWMLNEDPMATEKLSEGIRQFAKDLGLAARAGRQEGFRGRLTNPTGAVGRYGACSNRGDATTGIARGKLWIGPWRQRVCDGVWGTTKTCPI